MSHCKKFGKDQVIFVTKEDHETPSSVTLPEDDDEPKGLILSNGEINWNCPCLGGMATGPCGVQFRDAFSCFHYSTAEPKGSDCLEQFREMQVCMSQYPSLYPVDDDVKEDATEHLELQNTPSGQTSDYTDVSSSSQTTATESEHLKQN